MTPTDVAGQRKTAEQSARLAEDQEEAPVAVSRSVASLRRQITAAQREMEKLEVQLANATRRGEVDQVRQVYVQRAALAARRDLLQCLLDEAMRAG
jgi:uncharacterized protein (DUF342 family)